MAGVLLVVLDDARAEIIEDMPWLLGRRRLGTTFAAHRTPTPSCGPARAGLMSGQYARRSGIYDSQGAPAAIDAGTYSHDRLIAPWLTAAGVETCLVGYYAPGAISNSGWSRMRVTPFVGGQEHWHYSIRDEHGTATAIEGVWHHAYYTQQLADFFDTLSPTTDWFAQYSTNSPHIPFAVGPGQGLEHGLRASDWTLPPQDGTGWPTWITERPPVTDHNIGYVTRGQAREVADLDRHLAGLWAHLASLGLADTTTLVVTSDSGIHLGEQRLMGAALKNTMYDAALLSPLVVVGPGWPILRTATTPTVIQDITATILATFGATATIPQDGIDLRPVVANPSDYADRAVLCERRPGSGDSMPEANAVVTAQHKLIRYDTTGADQYELYDLQADPGELVNLAGDLPELRNDLEGRLDDLLSAPS